MFPIVIAALTLLLAGCADVDDGGPSPAAYDDLETRVTDLEGGNNLLSGRIDDLEAELDAALSDLEETTREMQDLCDAIDTEYFDSNSATHDMLFQLHLACI